MEAYGKGYHLSMLLLIQSVVVQSVSYKTRNQPKAGKTIQDQSQPAKNHPQPSKTNQNLFITTQNQPKVAKTTHI